MNYWAVYFWPGHVDVKEYPQEVLTSSNVGNVQIRSFAVCISSCHVDVKEYHHEANVIKHGRCPDVVFSCLFLFGRCPDAVFSCLYLLMSCRCQGIPPWSQRHQTWAVSRCSFYLSVSVCGMSRSTSTKCYRHQTWAVFRCTTELSDFVQVIPKARNTTRKCWRHRTYDTTWTICRLVTSRVCGRPFCTWRRTEASKRLLSQSSVSQSIG